MRYYKLIKNDRLVAIGTGSGGTEITDVEYNTLLSEIRHKATLVEQFYNGDITIADVPAEWQEEIQCRVDEWIAAEGESAEQEINGEEFMSMMEEVL